MTVSEVHCTSLPALPSILYPKRLPQHLAIISGDGNLRWTKANGLSVGKLKGVEACFLTCRDVARISNKWGIKAFTCFGLSSDNMRRPKAKVESHMENNSVMATFVQAVDSCSLSDEELRLKCREWIQSILQPFYTLNAEERVRKVVEFAQALREMPIALTAEETSEAMYEVPIEFYKIVLAKRLKYSCLYYAEPSFTLDQAEEAMLELYFERAQLKDGQSVLDLGGGWGALAFFIAEKCPASHVTTISYSKSQKEHIDNECRKRGISNVEAIDADLTVLDHPRTYDRVLCIELLEHFKNYSKLLKKISGWMKPEGLLFIEDFSHRFMPLSIEDNGDEGITSWISKCFFPNATFPSDDLLLYFQDDVSIVDHWIINGKHFAKTNEDGLKVFDENMDVIFPIFAKVYGEQNARIEIVRWRAFGMLFVEMFGFNNGEEWVVSQYLFTKK